MATTILTKNGTTGTPTNLADGELAVDRAAGKLWVGHNAGVTPIVGTGSDDGRWTDDGTNVWNTNSGNVGIGTNSPSANAKLAVTGTSNVGFEVQPDVIADTLSLAAFDRVALRYKLLNYGAEEHIFNTGVPTLQTERMRIDVDGNVGIGTDNPAQPLSIVNSAVAGIRYTSTGSTNASVEIENSTGQRWSMRSKSASLTFQDETLVEERMRIDASGRVGIGTDAPNATLHVEGAASVADMAIFERTGAVNTYLNIGHDVATNLFRIGMQSTGEAILNSRNTGAPMLFYTNNTEKMRIDSTGRVGIGTTSPEYQLDVSASSNCIQAQSTTTSARISFTNTVVTSNVDTRIELNSGSFDFRNNGAVRCSILNTGTFRVTNLAGTGNRAVYSSTDGNLTNSSSDGTLKKVLPDDVQGLDAVLAMNPVKYNWLDTEILGDQTEIGFVAQDMAAVVPEVVGANSDGTLTVDYPKLVAVMAKAIQELNAKVDALEV